MLPFVLNCYVTKLDAFVPAGAASADAAGRHPPSNIERYANVAAQHVESASPLVER